MILKWDTTMIDLPDPASWEENTQHVKVRICQGMQKYAGARWQVDVFRAKRKNRDVLRMSVYFTPKEWRYPETHIARYVSLGLNGQISYARIQNAIAEILDAADTHWKAYLRNMENAKKAKETEEKVKEYLNSKGIQTWPEEKTTKTLSGACIDKIMPMPDGTVFFELREVKPELLVKIKEILS